MPRKLLLLFAHPSYQRSRANRMLLEAVADLPELTVRDLYELYPDFSIDIEREQGLLLEHDALVLQHPLYWYSCPALLKEWLDVVLTHGFAYGEGAHALTGKPWQSVVTAGGGAQAYQREGSNRFSVAELLRPLEASAYLCGAVWQAPKLVLGAATLSDADLAEAAQSYRACLQTLATAEAR